MAVTFPDPGLTLPPLARPAPRSNPELPLAPVTRPRRFIAPSRHALVEHGGRLAIVLAVACIAIFLDASTSYESSIALPYIQGVVGATPDQGSWIVTLFNAAYETSTLLSPWFLTRFGRRDYFVGSLVAFAIASFGCAVVSDYTIFLILRMLQGFALGGFFACGVLSLFMSIPNPLRLIGVMLFSMSSQMGSAIGPAVAGSLVYADEWRWVFAIGALIALPLAVGIYFVLRDPVAPERIPFDTIGALSIATMFLSLQYLVNEGERRNWTDDPWVTLALFVTPIAAVSTLVWKLRFSPHPFLDFRVLRHRNLVVGAIFGFGFGILLQAATFIGGFVESTLEFTPSLAGNLDAVRAIAIVIFVPLVTFAIAEHFIDVRAALVLGLVTTFIGFRIEVLATTSGSEFASFIVPFAGIGIGIAILYRALASVIFGTLPPEDLIMGLLVYKMSGLLGGALAGPFLATTLDHRFAAIASDLAGGVTLASPGVQILGAAHRSVATLSHLVSEQAATLAYSDLWSLASIVVVLLVPVILLLDVRAATVTAK